MRQARFARRLPASARRPSARRLTPLPTIGATSRPVAASSGDGRRTALGQMLLAGLLHPNRAKQLSEEMPPMDDPRP